MTKTFSVVIDKGGVGKTTVIINALYYAAERLSAKCLLIDLDKSPSATARFFDQIDSEYWEGDKIKREYTVAAFFDGDNPVPIVINNNIDLIAGFDELSKLRTSVESGMQRMYLLNWYYQNLEWIESTYDYIFIDNHNDLEIFTDNAITISDVVIAVVDVDLDSMDRLNSVSSHVDYLKTIVKDPISQQSYVNAKVVKIGNMVEYNTNDSHAFKDALSELSKADSSFLGYLNRRTALKKTKSQNIPLTQVEDSSEKMNAGERKFFEDTWNLFDKIINY